MYFAVPLYVLTRHIFIVVCMDLCISIYNTKTHVSKINKSHYHNTDMRVSSCINRSSPRRMCRRITQWRLRCGIKIYHNFVTSINYQATYLHLRKYGHLACTCFAHTCIHTHIERHTHTHKHTRMTIMTAAYENIVE